MSTRAAGKPDDPMTFIEGIVEDVTERRAAEEALRSSEESYRALFDASPLPMWVYDPATLRITAVNDAALEQYGYSRGEMLAMTILDVRPPEFQDAVRDAVRSQPPGRHHGGVWKHRRKDGTLLDVDIHSNIVRAGGRELRLVLLQDVTELKSLEEQFRQSQKMEALGRLAGGVAHDFNNLLTVINGVAESLGDEVPRGSALAEGLAEIAAAGWRAADLSRRLLAFSRRQMMRREALDLSGVVEALGSILRRILGEDVVLVTDLASGLHPVMADRGQMEQVLVNLAVNARDAMPRGGRLEIRTREVDVLEGPESPGPYVEVSVGDDGTGIDPEVMPRLFEPFFTTKEPGKGTGLGLATAYGIVKQCGGHVVVESRPGEGATFRIRLPAGQPTDRIPVEAAPAHSPRTTGTGTVLLVEDEASLRRLAARVLRARGYAVLEAASPTDALALLESHAGTIDVLVTDVVMPSMDGSELATRTEALRPGIRVVFMSGYSQDSLALQGRLATRAGFLPKPFRPDELAVKVREVLEE